MTYESANELERVTGRIGPDQPAEGSGVQVQDLPGPTDYAGYQREGLRHAWTLAPDAQGRYHALTLRLEEGESTWAVTADQPFDRLDDAQEWATRLFLETEN